MASSRQTAEKQSQAQERKRLASKFTSSQYDFNANPNNLAGSDIKHVDLFSDTLLINYVNTNSAQPYAGQSGLCWDGNVYSFWENAGTGADGLLKKFSKCLRKNVLT